MLYDNTIYYIKWQEDSLKVLINPFTI